MNKAFFLDRDGVVNEVEAIGGVTYPPDNLTVFRFKQGIAALCRYLQEQDFKLFIVTNQPDVARGKQTREMVEAINMHAAEALGVLEVFTCFHDNTDNCLCRKPRPGLLTQAAEKYAVDLGQSYILGDRWSDIEAGRAAGCKTILLQNPYSRAEKCAPDFMVSGFSEIRQIITSTNF